MRCKYSRGDTTAKWHSTDLMTGTMCNHEFCWLCLADFQGIRTKGNAHHKEDCKYHSNNIALAWPFNAH